MESNTRRKNGLKYAINKSIRRKDSRRKKKSVRNKNIRNNNIRGAIGIGVDIIDISRFQKLNRKKHSHFLAKIFSDKEIDYCYSKKNYGQHLAARFAAKEAILKATYSAGVNKNNVLSMRDIEIFNNEEGVPRARIKKGRIRAADICLSMSHEKKTAIAFAVMIVK